MQCNYCWSALDQDSKHVVTPCLHLYCLSCVQKLLDNDSPCNVCQAPLSQSTVKAVQLFQDASKYKLALCGQTPEVIMQTALTAINFYHQQSELGGQFRENKLKRRMDALHAQCNEKLQQVHVAYTKAKNKNQLLASQKQELQQENEELVAKYQQRSNQLKLLKEQLANVQQQQKVQQQHPMMLGQGSAPGMMQQGGSNGATGRMSPSGGMGQMITTVQQRTSYFSTADPAVTTPPGLQGMQVAQMMNGPGPSRRQSMGGALLGGSADLSPGMGGIGSAVPAMGGQQQRRGGGGQENMMMMSMGPGQGKMGNAQMNMMMGNQRGGSGGGGGRNSGNVMQPSHRHNHGMNLGSPNLFQTASM